MKRNLKKPVGRPTKYQDSYYEEVISLMSQGMQNCQIAAKWDISEDTFYTWRKENESFAEAYNIGLAKRRAWWDELGLKFMKEGNAKGFNYWISFRNKYDDFKGVDSNATSITNNTQINITHNNISIEQMSQEQLLEYIEDKSQEVKVIDVIPLEEQEPKENKDL